MEGLLGGFTIIAMIGLGFYAFLKWSQTDDNEYAYPAEITDHWTLSGLKSTASRMQGSFTGFHMAYIVVFKRIDTGEELQFETDSETYSFDIGTKGTLMIDREKFKKFIPAGADEA